MSRTLVAALAVLSLGILPCRAQGDAEPMAQAAGAWRIEPAPEPNQESFSLATSAVGNTDATFALWCKPEPSEHYFFVVRDPRLAKLPLGAEATLAIRAPDQELVRLQAGSPGDGSVMIQERVHQTAFSLILATLTQARARQDAASVEVSIDEHQWVFALNGFAALMPSLIKQCGFAPDPARARQRGRR